MSEPFSIPCVVNPAVKMHCSTPQVKKVRSRELRGSKLFNKCRCNARNGLQLECPLAECQVICSKDQSKCPFLVKGRAVYAAGDHRRANECIQASVEQSDDTVSVQDCAENQVMYQQTTEPQGQNDPYTVQEGYLQDGQTVIQTKNGAPMNLNDGDVAFIDYGYPPNMSFPQYPNTPQVTMSPKSDGKSGQKLKDGPSTTTMGGYPMMQQPCMMPPNQFCYPGYQPMPYMNQSGAPAVGQNMVTSSGTAMASDKSGSMPTPMMQTMPAAMPGMMMPPYPGMYSAMPAYYNPYMSNMNQSWSQPNATMAMPGTEVACDENNMQVLEATTESN